MAGIKSWVPAVHEKLGPHRLVHMGVSDDTVDAGIDWAAAVIPRQYAASAKVARILRRLDRPAAAEYLEDKLPTTPRTRSGELGEIFGSQYAARELGYRMIARLRWKDHRQMPMRGDDIVGARVSKTGRLEFLKGEAKSRARLDAGTVSEADKALQNDNGRPSAHALAFFADRLDDQGEGELADRIYAAQLSTRIDQRQVLQLLFTLTGNDPRTILRTSTTAYGGSVTRHAVGLQVPGHQAFIAAVYAKVVSDASKP